MTWKEIKFYIDFKTKPKFLSNDTLELFDKIYKNLYDEDFKHIKYAWQVKQFNDIFIWIRKGIFLLNLYEKTFVFSKNKDLEKTQTSILLTSSAEKEKCIDYKLYVIDHDSTVKPIENLAPKVTGNMIDVTNHKGPWNKVFDKICKTELTTEYNSIIENRLSKKRKAELNDLEKARSIVVGYSFSDAVFE